MLTALSGRDQLDLFGTYVDDPRSRVGTGIEPLDRHLRRGGLAAGELALLGGRPGTRKTAIVINIIVNMLRNGVATGVVGLDENGATSYIAKILSAMSGASLDRIEETWPNKHLLDEYETLAENLVMYEGNRPSLKTLSGWLMECEVVSVKPQVVFIDYASLLARWHQDGGENQRVMRLMEGLKVWTKENEVATVALHHIGRLTEGQGLRNHGDTPMTADDLRYGGEEVADIVLGAYRPSLDPIAEMRWEIARAYKGDKFTEEDYQGHIDRARKYQDFTFLQLLKNRPSLQPTGQVKQGLPLRSLGESMKMEIDMSILDDEVQAYGP